MATSDPVRLLQEEVTCAVCLDYLHEPVTIDCGHNFCRACITRCWDEMGRRFPCPQCRARSPKRKLRPNCQLANVAMAAKRLRPNVSEDGELGPGGSVYKSLDTREPEEELVSTLAEEEEEARGIQAYETSRALEDKPQEPQEARDRELEPESLPGTARETEGEPEPRVDNRREEAWELEARELLEAERREAQDGRPQKGPVDSEEGQSGRTEGQPQNHQEDPAHETRWLPKEVTLEGEEEKAKGSFEIKPEKTPQEEEDVVGSSRLVSSEVGGQRAELRLERNVPQSFCPQHPGEELWLFCRWDGATLCPSCEPERAHEGHDLVVLDEEGQAAKARLRGALDRLRAQKEALEDAGIRQERQVIHLGEEAALRRQRLGDEFEELRHFLSKAEHDLLNSLTTAEHQAQAARRARGARLWANAQRLDRLLLEASAWLLLPSARLLGDSNVQEGLRNLEAEASRNLGARVIPGEGLGGAGRAQAVLKEAARAFRERLLGELDRDEPPVRFDTNSAAPGLEVSEGRRTVKLTPRVSTQQADLCPCILGDKAWQDGSHYWEVDVSQSGGWAVGVASDSNPRPQPNRGLWALQLSKGQLWTPEVTLAVRQQPRRLAIYLEVEAGLLAFSDAQSGAPVHSYQGADWGPNANLRPCFWLWDLGGCLRLSP